MKKFRLSHSNIIDGKRYVWDVERLWVLAKDLKAFEIALANNGLGRSAAEAIANLAYVRSLFAILDDTPDILPEWQRLVTTLPVLGKGAHDARLIAASLAVTVRARLVWRA